MRNTSNQGKRRSAGQIAEKHTEYSVDSHDVSCNIPVTEWQDGDKVGWFDLVEVSVVPVVSSVDYEKAKMYSTVHYSTYGYDYVMIAANENLSNYRTTVSTVLVHS